MALQAGDKAPNFKLETDAGRGLQGRPEGQTLCGLFLSQGRHLRLHQGGDRLLRRRSRKFEKLGVFVLGVSKDSLASHEKFKTKHKLKIALGSDPDIEMAKDWDVWGEKSLYGRKYMGMERATFLVDAKGVIAAGLAQGESPRPCRSRAGSGKIACEKTQSPAMSSARG